MIADILTFAGGIGLFLLGMRLMTDGLQRASGSALRSILAAATRSRMRGLMSGLLITTAVQSSSAVIFATIGFVNSGLLGLSQAVGVVYGSNIGTTLTSWIVALLGFNIDLRALAMPAIGIGMGTWVLGRDSRWGALGQAIAGFGLFFLGIDVLRESFSGLGAELPAEEWASMGSLATLVFLVAGIFLTTLMQSSSAALAVTLTAAGGGLVPLHAAAAMVIGANVGTTSTAVFAAIGATPPAKRVAAAHVTFNVVTATVSLATLPLLIGFSEMVNAWLTTTPQLAVTLAIFHTLTKLLGTVLMWPITGHMVRWLEDRFRNRQEDEARPQHLDATTLATPALAGDALVLELHRMSSIAREMASGSLSGEAPMATELVQRHHALEALQQAIAEFTARMHNAQASTLTHDLPNALRVAQYLVNVGEHSVEIARLQRESHSDDPTLSEALASLRGEAAALLAAARLDRKDWDRTGLEAARASFELNYQSVKAQLLRAGSSGALGPHRMARILEHSSLLHRLCDQAVKAALYLDTLCAAPAQATNPP